MTATLTHTTATYGGANPKSSAASLVKKLLLALATWTEIFAEAQEEARKAQARYPFIVD